MESVFKQGFIWDQMALAWAMCVEWERPYPIEYQDLREDLASARGPIFLSY